LRTQFASVESCLGGDTRFIATALMFLCEKVNLQTPAQIKISAQTKKAPKRKYNKPKKVISAVEEDFNSNPLNVRLKE
jgi:hypothetical protein